MPIISPGGVTLGAGSVPIADIADPTTGKVIGSASNAAAAVNPPGFEFGYDQITGTVSVASIDGLNPTTIISCAAHTFDGATVLCQVYCVAVGFDTAAVNDRVLISLWEGATELGRLIRVPTVETSAQALATYEGWLRFTPTAAAHTYTVAAFASSLTGGPSIQAGAGGVGNLVPSFVRFTKV